MRAWLRFVGRYKLLRGLVEIVIRPGRKRNLKPAFDQHGCRLYCRHEDKSCWEHPRRSTRAKASRCCCSWERRSCQSNSNRARPLSGLQGCRCKKQTSHKSFSIVYSTTLECSDSASDGSCPKAQSLPYAPTYFQQDFPQNPQTLNL